VGKEGGMTKQNLYKSDIALWSEDMARLLRERRFDEVDVENVAEEIESLGRSDKQQLENRIIEIIEHLLKLDLMTGDDRTRNERGWNNSIREQQRRIARLFKESPSLRTMLTPEFLEECYQEGVKSYAASDFGCYANAPRECPFTWEEILAGLEEQKA